MHPLLAKGYLSLFKIPGNQIKRKFEVEKGELKTVTEEQDEEFHLCFSLGIGRYAA